MTAIGSGAMAVTDPRLRQAKKPGLKVHRDECVFSFDNPVSLVATFSIPCFVYERNFQRYERKSNAPVNML